MLTGVVNDPGATGNEAQIPGYTVAGKTGTAQVATPHGYSTTDYTASFVGMVPASHPRLVVLVKVDDPRGSIFGGVVAAPGVRGDREVRPAVPRRSARRPEDADGALIPPGSPERASRALRAVRGAPTGARPGCTFGTEVLAFAAWRAAGLSADGTAWLADADPARPRPASCAR